MRTDRETERKAAMAMGIAVSIFGIFFVVIWCVIAASIGAWFMILFAIPVAGFLVLRLVFMLRQPKRDPWDIPHRRSPDPASVHSAVEDVFERAANRGSEDARSGRSPRFCHSCSNWIHNDFQFCPKCGRRIF